MTPIVSRALFPIYELPKFPCGKKVVTYGANGNTPATDKAPQVGRRVKRPCLEAGSRMLPQATCANQWREIKLDLMPKRTVSSDTNIEPVVGG